MMPIVVILYKTLNPCYAMLGFVNVHESFPKRRLCRVLQYSGVFHIF